MKHKLFLVLSVFAALAVLLTACATPTAPPPVKETVEVPVTKEVQVTVEVPVPVTVPPLPTEAPFEGPKGALVSYPVSTAPVIDGSGSDAVWAEAQETVIKVDPAGLKAFNFTMKSVYTPDTAYFLVQYPDNTMDVNRSAWAFDPATKIWSRLADDFGDEDEFGFWWNMTMPDYAAKGCTQACHLDKMLAPTGTTADDWRWNAARSDPMMWGRDFYMTDNPDADPVGGFTKDEGFEVNRGYEDNVQTVDGVEIPAYWKPFSGAGGVSVGNPLFLLQAEIDAGIAKKIVGVDKTGVLTDETGATVPLWVHIPGRILSAPAGPSWNDITAKGMWLNGVWTVELSRKLVTGHADDLDFKDLTATYYFDGYIKTRQPGEKGPHNIIPTTPFVFKPVK